MPEANAKSKAYPKNNMLVVKPVALCTCDKKLHEANSRIRNIDFVVI